MDQVNSDYDQAGRRVRLVVEYPELPPSSNKLYFRGTMLKKEAREYRERFKIYVAQRYGHQILELIDPKQDPRVIFALHLTFYLDCMNETWGDTSLPPSRRASSRYKRIDLSNRIKLLEDCLKHAVDLDDSLTFAASQEKIHDPLNPRVRLVLEQANPDLFGVG